MHFGYFVSLFFYCACFDRDSFSKGRLKCFSRLGEMIRSKVVVDDRIFQT